MRWRIESLPPFVEVVSVDGSYRGCRMDAAAAGEVWFGSVGSTSCVSVCVRVCLCYVVSNPCLSHAVSHFTLTVIK